jgi:hypothetical protein
LKQIRDADPYVLRAIDAAKYVLSELDVNIPGQTVDLGRFDDAKYSILKSNLETAIKITEMQPYNNSGFNISQVVENDKQRIYNKNIKGVNEEYARKKKEITVAYTSRLNNTSNTTGSNKGFVNKTGSAFNEDGLKIDYQFQMEKLNSWREWKKQQVIADAELKAYANGSNYVEAYEDSKSKFTYDVNYMMKELSNLLSNSRKAAESYNESVIYSNRSYMITGTIKMLLNEALYLMRQSSALSKDAAIAVIEKANALMEMAHDKFKKQLDLSGFTISDSELCMTVNQGHQLLLTADYSLNAAITKALIDIINAPEASDKSTAEFNAFIKRLEAIKDFKGEPKKWITMASKNPLPYIELVASTVSLATLLPTTLVSNRQKDRDNINRLFKKSQDSISTLVIHNSIVMQTLQSYTPYKGSEMGDLTALLSKIGMLGTFAKVSSIILLSVEIATKCTGPVASLFSPARPTKKNCKRAYPELYIDKNLNTNSAINAAIEAMNVPSAIANNSMQSKLEDKAVDIVGTRGQLVDYDHNANVKDSDLLNNISNGR